MIFFIVSFYLDSKKFYFGLYIEKTYVLKKNKLLVNENLRFLSISQPLVFSWINELLKSRLTLSRMLHQIGISSQYDLTPCHQGDMLLMLT